MGGRAERRKGKRGGGVKAKVVLSPFAHMGFPLCSINASRKSVIHSGNPGEIPHFFSPGLRSTQGKEFLLEIRRGENEGEKNKRHF